MECLKFWIRMIDYIFWNYLIYLIGFGCLCTAGWFLFKYSTDKDLREYGMYWSAVIACIFTGIGTIRNAKSQKELNEELREAIKALHDLKKAIIENGKINMRNR